MHCYKQAPQGHSIQWDQHHHPKLEVVWEEPVCELTQTGDRSELNDPSKAPLRLSRLSPGHHGSLFPCRLGHSVPYIIYTTFLFPFVLCYQFCDSLRDANPPVKLGITIFLGLPPKISKLARRGSPAPNSDGSATGSSICLLHASLVAHLKVGIAL